MARLAIEWARLRLALGLTQADFADVLGLADAKAVRRLERGDNGIGAEPFARLALFLMLEGPRARLKRAGVPNPIASERAAAVRLWNRAALRNPPGPARPCPGCGVPLGLHARCRRCPQLLGDAHGQPLAPDGLCRSCRAAARAAGRAKGRAIVERRSA